MAKTTQLRLRTGDPAPSFTAVTHTGETLSLDQFRNRNDVVLYFYPRDDTPGCTREACGFRDAWAALQQAGAVVLGVSTDSAKAHDRFATKHRLPFPLLVDEDRRIVTAYGVWGEKTFMGRRYQGTHRVTFLVGRDGRIRRIWDQVKPATHAAEVLEAVRAAHAAPPGGL